MRLTADFNQPLGGNSPASPAVATKGKKEPPRPSSDDPKVQQRMFLAAYEVSGNISSACEVAGITRRVHDDWKEDDTDYLIAYGEAQKKAADILEASARDWALEGVPRHKFYKGSMILNADGTPYVEYQRSETLLMFLLRANNPEKFGSNAVPGDGPVAKTYVNLQIDQFGSVVREAQAVPSEGRGAGALEERGS